MGGGASRRSRLVGRDERLFGGLSRLIELVLQHLVSASQTGGHFPRPGNVFKLTPDRPVRGRACRKCAQIAGFIGELNILIQSHQYVEEQGQNPNDLALYGQDSNGTVWSICIMNMILHNITRFTIENGDTLEDPLDSGQRSDSQI